MTPRRLTPLRDARHAFAQSVTSPNLRRAQLAFALIWTGEWAVLVAVGVVAFGDGGPAAVGLVAALRMLPAALLAPLAATVADALRRERVLASIGLIRAVTLSAAAGVLAVHGSLEVVYGLVTLATIAQTLYRPAHSALLPALCAGPQELTSANVVRGLLDSLATLAGPLAAALALQLSGPALVFAVCGAGSLVASLLLVGVRCEPPSRPRGEAIPDRNVLGGFRAILADSDLMLITGLTTVQTFTRGAFSVFSVIIAIELLETGAAGVGILNGAVGAGAVLGSLLTVMLIRGGGLAGWFGMGVSLWGLPLAVVAAAPGQIGVVALLATIGIGNALVDVGAFTLPARLAPDRVMARMFAALEGVLTLGVAIGAAATPLAVGLLGTRGALIAIGLAGPLAVAAMWPALGRLDARILARAGSLGGATSGDRRGRSGAPILELPLLELGPSQRSRGAGVCGGGADARCVWTGTRA